MPSLIGFKRAIFFLKSNMINRLSDINECEANPCQNDGTCRNTVGSFICTCAAGYNGYTCQNGKYSVSNGLKSNLDTLLKNRKRLFYNH